MLSIGFLQGTLLLVSGYSPISCDKLLCRQACLVDPSSHLKSRQALCKYNKIRLLRGRSMDGSATTGVSS
ncbi:hypothetical protein NC653_010847 [Populus alba x Populus x berolinensis]|uniref:Secreted protein n=1 Tax=Populus alba x Populus x berolinensis TaxID=444605 RepID=A0AAD6R0P4_9ROSI|nr:hypothetical protein NC653_010847 [Populus alba x Populus x berolinensis]